MRSNKKERRKRKDKRKKKRKTKKETKKERKKQRELVPQACTNWLFPSLPLKILPFANSKERDSSGH